MVIQSDARNQDRSTLDTFPKLLIDHAKVRGSKMAMREKDYGIWQSWTWSEALTEVSRLAGGLASMGFARGDRLAVIGDNRPRLYWAMLAAQSLGGIPVPMYQDAVADEMDYVLEHGTIAFAIAEDQEQVDKLLVCKQNVESLAHIVYDDPRGLRNYRYDFLHSWEEMGEMGDSYLKNHPGFFETEVAKGTGDDISVILYTSGTTGRSKGVCLLHGRTIAAARSTADFDHLTDADEVLAYLPMAWVGDHYLNYAQGMVAGYCLSIPESTTTVEHDLREIGPTYYFAPPRVFEGLLTRVMIRMEDAGAIKRWLFRKFIDVAKQYGEDLLDGRPVPFKGKLLYALGEILVYGPLKNVLGLTRVRVAYTAGEAIGPDLFSFFRSLGINLKQLYGQTEAFLYVTVQADGNVRPDTVGPPAPNTDVKIAEDGEVLFKSPGMFTGYYKDEEKTAETITEDGYVRTGDAGFFDAEGHLKIIDRAKDVGRLNDGSLFAPKYIENKLKFFPFIKEAVTFGHERDEVTAFINIDLEAVGNWAEKRNLAYTGYTDLAARDEVYDLIRDNIEQVNKDLADDGTLKRSQITRFLILHKELDADDGELTRTRKVRRRFIADKYAALIEALFSGQDTCYVETEMTFEDGRKGIVKADLKITNSATTGLDASDLPPLKKAS